MPSLTRFYRLEPEAWDRMSLREVSDHRVYMSRTLRQHPEEA